MLTIETLSPRRVIILSIIGVIVLAVAVIIQYAPSKFFNDSVHAGIGLLRDDQELGVYYERIQFALHGGVPYQYARIEYPPLAVAYLTIPTLFFKSFESYRFGLLILNGLTALCLIWFTYRLLLLFGRNKKILWLFALPSFVYFIFNRFDVLPALLTQIALLLLLKKRFGWSFFVLSLLFLAKGYAIVLFPIFFLFYLNSRQIPKGRLLFNRTLLIFIAPTVLITGIICLFAGFENGLFPYIYQSTRFFGYGAIYTIYYQSVASWLPPVILKIGANAAIKLMVFLQILLPILFYTGYQIFRKYLRTDQDVVNWTLLGLILYIFFSPYYSPQWFVWLLPLLVLIAQTRKAAWLIVVYDLVNYLQFPVIWQNLSPYSTAFDLTVLARTILLVVITVKVWQRMAKPPLFKESYSSEAVLVRK